MRQKWEFLPTVDRLEQGLKSTTFLCQDIADAQNKHSSTISKLQADMERAQVHLNKIQEITEKAAREYKQYKNTGAIPKRTTSTLITRSLKESNVRPI